MTTPSGTRPSIAELQVVARDRPREGAPVTLDASTCRRLAAECREDDAKTPASWRLDGRFFPPHILDGADQYVGQSGIAGSQIARTRDNLSEVASQLEASAEMAERFAEVGVALGVGGQSPRAIAEAAWEASALVMAGVTVRTERDAARAEADQLRARAAEMEGRLSRLQSAHDLASGLLTGAGQRVAELESALATETARRSR